MFNKSGPGPEILDSTGSNPHPHPQIVREYVAKELLSKPIFYKSTIDLIIKCSVLYISETKVYISIPQTLVKQKEFHPVENGLKEFFRYFGSFNSFIF